MLASVPASSLSDISSWASLTSISPLRQSLLSKQCAAVRTCFLEMRTPAQILIPHLFTRETIQGKLPSSAGVPFKMFNCKDDNPHFSVSLDNSGGEGEDVVENLFFLAVPVSGLGCLFSRNGVKP